MRRTALLLAVVALSELPALAQTDMLTGMWRPLFRNEDGSGMDGDYAGLPLSAAGRLRAMSWAPENFDVPEFVCRPHSWDFSVEAGAAQMRITPEIDDPTQRLVAYHGRLSMREQETTIWMDGRQRPPDYALHTWSGFATGEWDGDVLVESVTHLKENYIRRWGPMRSDDATVRLRYKRLNNNYLRATVIIYDPVYMAEPYVRTSLIWALDPSLVLPPYPCEEATESVVEHGAVPHYLPGKSLLPAHNPNEHDQFGTPYEARLGGPETMYPEYIKKLGPFPRPNAKETAAPVAVMSTARVDAQSPRPAWAWKPAIEGASDGQLHVLPVRGRISMLVGAGGNITVSSGSDGVLLVDTGTAAMSDQVLAAVRAIAPRGTIRYIVNSSERDAFTGGNEKIALAGNTIRFRIATDPRVSDALSKDRASVIAFISVFERMSAPTGQVATRPEDAWPDDTYSSTQKKLYFNDEPVLIMHVPSNTDGNSIVHFRQDDVVSAGDLIDMTSYPYIDVKAGGGINQIVEALNRLLEITVTSPRSERGTLVIPGRGRLLDQSDVAYYREMVAIIRDRIQDGIRRGLTLAQIKAAKPTLDYDPRFGHTAGPWTTDMFIEAAYRSLGGK